MSDLNSVPATKIAAGSQVPATGPAAKNAAAGNFWDAVLTKLASGGLADGVNDLIKTAVAAPTTTTISTPNAATAPAIATTPVANAAPATKPSDNPLALLQIALSNQTVDENGNIVLPDATTPDDVKGLKTQLDLTNTMINHLKNALPENAEKTGILNQVLAKLQNRSDTLQASISALEGGTLPKDTPLENIPTPMLISLGLTPAEIAQVSDNVKALEEKLGRDVTIEDLLAGLTGIIPPVQLAKNTNAPTDVSLTIDGSTEPTDDLAAKLNALDVGAGDADTADATDADVDVDVDANAKTGTPVSTATDAKADIDGLPVTATEKSKARYAEPDVDTDKRTVKTDAPGNAPTESQIKKAAANFKEQLLSIHNNAGADAGDIVVPTSLFGTNSGADLWQQAGVQPTSSMNLGTVAQAANITNTAAHAGQPNPATQLVAATMTRAGKEGVADTVSIRLDPPELGSVNVRLEFGKDKSVKAHLLVEKPETYLMLQRDGLALERALQNAGLDANSASISFELAQGGGNFNPDNNGQGGGERNMGSSSPSEGTDDDANVIKSTMNWQVDSNTGHVHYNIFA